MIAVLKLTLCFGFVACFGLVDVGLQRKFLPLGGD